MSATYPLRWLTADEIPAWREHVAATYRTAFAPPPYLRTERNVQEFLVSFETHQREPGFQFLGAFAGTPPQLVGFAYVRRALPGQWWYSAVAPPLRQAGLGFWLEDSYQLVELAVHLGYQRRGIGTRLIEAAADGQSALYLHVNRENQQAIGFYEKVGFVRQSEAAIRLRGRMVGEYLMVRRIETP